MFLMLHTVRSMDTGYQDDPGLSSWQCGFICDCSCCRNTYSYCNPRHCALWWSWNISCHGYSDGQIDLGVKGGFGRYPGGQYYYEWKTDSGSGLDPYSTKTRMI